MTHQESKSIQKFRNNRHLVTIKPADKNLGIVVLDTNDYVNECINHLSSPSYQLVSQYPQDLKKLLENTLLNFKKDLTNNIHNSKSLYNHLFPSHLKQYRTPRFYGLPKIHKQFINFPPIRPIVSQTDCILSITAKFLDYCLQPLAQQYEDYLHNSTHLINTLESFNIPNDTLLVTLDIVNLFPSIPQQECLDIIYEQLCEHNELLSFNPNLIMHLLSIHMKNNFFEFAEFHFHQTTGIPMGSAFSPTIANIFVSVLLKRFLTLSSTKPHLLMRYVDDILMLWPKNQNLSEFINNLNKAHQNIKFTSESSVSSINFLDVCISLEKDESTTKACFTTFQKANSLYQYLQYSSAHPKTTFKGIIIGESIRYVRTNSSEDTYNTQINLFTSRLRKRGYPSKFIFKCLHQVNFSNRAKYLQSRTNTTGRTSLRRPLFKTLFPPNYTALQQIIFRNFSEIKHLVKPPLFIYRSPPSLRQHLISSKLYPSDSQFIDIYTACYNEKPINTPNITPPNPKNIRQVKPTPCHHHRCETCQYFNKDVLFQSSKTKKQYRIRLPFSCTSKNIIYLITCSRCKKQYVGQTTTMLKERINRHTAAIRAKKNVYIYNHFNFPDHNIFQLTVQVIDTTTTDNLTELERYWILTLQTQVPFGLNLKV